MTTTLKRFSQAYATMTIAAYEPIIYVGWVSQLRLKQLADAGAGRMRAKRQGAGEPEYFAMGMAARMAREDAGADPAAAMSMAASPMTAERTAGLADPQRVLAEAGVTPVELEGFPHAVAFRGRIFPTGLDPELRRRLGLEPGAGGAATAADPDTWARGGVVNVGRVIGGKGGTEPGRAWPAGRPPMAVGFGKLAPGFTLEGPQLQATRKLLFDALREGAVGLVRAGKRVDADAIAAVMAKGGQYWVPGLWKGLPVEMLSPIGIAHYFRQLYFNIEEGVGPIEEALTVAPLETLEVLYESTRRRIHGEEMELGSETVSEKATEQKNLDEVSDKVSSMIQRDASASMSVEAGASLGVYNFSASASASLSASSQRSREESSRRMKELTTRASERITKSFTVKTRSVTEATDRSMTRRVIRNDSSEPVAYGLRRVLRRVRVKLQSLGPKLVWQLYVRDPGAGLRTSRFVHFREAEDIAVPDLPPGLPPRPMGGTDTGSTSSALLWDAGRRTYFVEIVIDPGADRVVTAVSIDSITDLEGGGKSDLAPSPRNGVQWDQQLVGNTFSVKIGVLEGDSASVTVNYTYAWDPAAAVLTGWEAERRRLQAVATQELLQAKFEQDRALITLQSKVRPRPANDLRREERYEIMNRMVSRLFAAPAGTHPPTPLEIESFHRYFDLEAMFVTTHPSWWRPRYSRSGTFHEEPYPITAESEPAPLGSSLGWMMQLDGDARRNEFLNSPWARICIPLRPNTERAALAWLSEHLEGEIGYDPATEPLKGLLQGIETIRQRQGAAGPDGPEWVRADSEIDNPAAPANPLTPEGTYPVVHEFDVTVPTDGFVYEALEIDGN